MTLTVHMGIHKDELPALNNQIKRMVPEGIDLRTDSDHWDAWGEKLKLAEDGSLSDWNVVHVCVDTITPMAILNLLAARFDTYMFPRFDGPKMVVTDTDDYDVEYIEFRYPGE